MARPFEFSQAVKDEARLRQDGVCAVCGHSLDDTEEHAHHVVPNQSGDAKKPEDAWIRGVDNCVVLCDVCHYRVHEDGQYRTGATAPPSYYEHSHGNHRAEHLDWVAQMNKRIAQWVASSALATLNDYRVTLQNRLSLSSGEHKMQKDLADNSFAGFAINALLNGPCPELMIWNNAFARLAAAERALRHADVREAYKNLIYANREYVSAMNQYLKWKNNIEAAGATATVGLALMPIAVPVAIWAGAAALAWAAEAAGIGALTGAGAAGADGVVTAEAAGQTVVRIAETCERANAVFRVVDVAVEAGDAATVDILELEMEELERLTLWGGG